MTDLEISKQLALAIGWKPEQMIHYKGQDYIGLMMPICGRLMVRLFSYKYWVVAGPIAERYNVFPYMHKSLTGVPDGKWVVYPDTLEDTPHKAIAMAVIEGAKK